MKKSLLLGLSLSAMLAFSAQAFSASTSFEDPSTASWGNWDRGDADTIYAQWETIDGAPYDGSPDVAGSQGYTAAGLVTNNAGGFITGGGLGGNIYSIDTGDFTAYVGAASAITGPVTVALQIATLGTALDTASVMLNDIVADSITTLFSGASGSSWGGDATESLFIWELTSGLTSYVFDFLATGGHMSLDAVSIDIGAAAIPTTPSAVPVPAAALLFGPALLGMVGFRRKLKA